MNDEILITISEKKLRFSFWKACHSASILTMRVEQGEDQEQAIKKLKDDIEGLIKYMKEDKDVE
jgi:hypothetical protein